MLLLTITNLLSLHYTVERSSTISKNTTNRDDGQNSSKLLNEAHSCSCHITNDRWPCYLPPKVGLPLLELLVPLLVPVRMFKRRLRHVYLPRYRGGPSHDIGRSITVCNFLVFSKCFPQPPRLCWSNRLPTHELWIKCNVNNHVHCGSGCKLVLVRHRFPLFLTMS